MSSSWKTFDLSSIGFAGARNGTTKFTGVRFQIPRGRILFGGLSGYKSVTIETTDEFAQWWRTELEPALAGGLTPFKSNMSGKNLRLKVDTSTQVFDSSRKIKFPELVEGAFAGQTVTCIAEITGTYYFQDIYGLTCRVYQMIEREVPTVEEDSSPQLKGFAFIADDDGSESPGAKSTSC